MLKYTHSKNLKGAVSMMTTKEEKRELLHIASQYVVDFRGLLRRDYLRETQIDLIFYMPILPL